MTIDIREAKAHLSRLVDEAAQGRDIVIAKAGRPMAKLVPLSAPSRKKTFGLLKGRIRVGKDFDAPLPPDVLAEFEGGKARAASSRRRGGRDERREA